MRCEYKRAEAGRIPEDWQHTTVGRLVDDDILEAPLDGNHGELHPTTSDFVSSGIPFVMANNVVRGTVDLVKCAFITKTRADSLRKGFAIEGDVLLTHKATIGNTAVLGPLASEYIMLTPQVTYYRVRDRKRLSNSYLRHCFDGAAFQGALHAMSGGGTRAYIGIVSQRQLPLVLPSTLREQEAIADVLNDANALIESLEKLLAKKRHIKQGTMQDLLTSRGRLPGFEDEWVVRELGQVADIRSGGTPNTKQPTFWDGEIPWCTPTDITALGSRKYLHETERRITQEGLRTSAGEMIPAQSIVMTSRATIGACAINAVPVSTNQGFKNFVPFEGVDSEFLYYLLSIQKAAFVSLCGGSTFLEIGKAQLAVFAIRLPSTKMEQTAIATILSDMDAEIAALEAKLAKTRQVKEGMMQELLTGRIRLV